MKNKPTAIEKEKMKIYQLNTEEDIFIVIAKDKKQAKKIVIHEYFDDDPDINWMDIEVSDIVEGLLVHYDSEDFYFSKLK